ncbi:MAG: DUF3077 domain-containing protein [Pseudomonas sp.]|uniref:DUF3077 domain-containing protein n=1 Tax=Pseudomonas sp. TaxID=306 RepID=UPI003D1041DD
MIKIVPDPPACPSRPTTVLTHFGACGGTHAPLFSVRAQLDIKDALVHLSAALTSAQETNAQLCEKLSRPASDLAWGTCQSLEISQALTQALLAGMVETSAQG